MQKNESEDTPCFRSFFPQFIVLIKVGKGDGGIVDKETIF